MYCWEGQSPLDAAQEVMHREATRFRTGYAVGNGQHSGLRWFSDRTEMAHFIARIEPMLWVDIPLAGLKLKEALQTCKALIDVHGLSNDALNAHNVITQHHYQLLWWGTLDTLKSDDSPWPKDQRHGFFSTTGIRENTLPNRLTQDFLAYLKKSHDFPVV